MDKILKISLKKIRQNPHQMRSSFDDEDLDALAASIKSVGIIHPPTLRYIKASDEYELIAGERRVRAALRAGLESISAFITEVSDFASAQAALIENIQRVDLNPIEFAIALRQLIENFSLTQEALAKQIGKPRATIANILRLLTLPIPIQSSLEKRLITTGHAKAILSLKTDTHQLLLHELILRDELSVRKTESLALSLTKKHSKMQTQVKKNSCIYLEQLQEELQQHFKTKVSIHAKHDKGSITFEYYDLDDLESLLKKFSFQRNDLIQ